MEKRKEGDWYIIREKTTKPFQRFQAEADKALLQGLFGIATSHSWSGNVCDVKSLGCEGTITYEAGVVTSRIRFNSWWVLAFKDKILSDIENTTGILCEVPVSINKNVFIVHGHNETARTQLSHLLRDLGLNPVVLSEQNDLGMTIIEKFEYYAKDCSFAFVLMTPDDKAGQVAGVEARWRARQNVIMELGWFMARLGRDRVVILYNGELEIPSDILGIVFLEFNGGVGEVRERICQRLSGVGLIGSQPTPTLAAHPLV